MKHYSDGGLESLLAGHHANHFEKKLIAVARQLLAERDRALTPSIVEALKLLDDAGYGNEVPNSLSEMIKKVLAERDEARRQNERLQNILIDLRSGGREGGCWCRYRAELNDTNTVVVARSDDDHDPVCDAATRELEKEIEAL